MSIRNISPKKLAKLGGKRVYSTIAAPRKPVKKVNTKRRKSEFARCYGSKARVEFVKSLPCCMCGVVGLSDNAHIKTGGMGRKSDYTQIVPLCRSTPASRGYILSTGQIGCHDMYHNLGRIVLEATGINFEELAAETEQAWKLFQENQK